MFEVLGLLIVLAGAGVVLLALVAVAFVLKILFKLLLLPVKLAGGLLLGLLVAPLVLLALPLAVVAIPIVLVGMALCAGLLLACGIVWLGCHAFAWIV